MEVDVCTVCAKKLAIQFLTVDECAEVLTVSKMTVYRLMEKGDLKGVRIGRQFRIKASDFDEYLKRIAA